MGVSFYSLASTPLKERKRLKQFLQHLADCESHELGTLSVIFCSDEYLLTINRDHLQHDYYTDIITFDLTEMEGQPIEAELYISIDRVIDNAAQFGSTVKMELHRVIFHGLLHLCGYGDKTRSAKRLMTEKENFYLQAYFDVPRGA